MRKKIFFFSIFFSVYCNCKSLSLLSLDLEFRKSGKAVLLCRFWRVDVSKQATLWELGTLKLLNQEVLIKFKRNGSFEATSLHAALELQLKNNNLKMIQVYGSNVAYQLIIIYFVEKFHRFFAWGQAVSKTWPFLFEVYTLGILSGNDWSYFTVGVDFGAAW